MKTLLVALLTLQSHLPSLFEEYKRDAVSILAIHLRRHPDCELSTIDPEVVMNAPIRFYGAPHFKYRAQVLNGAIIFNKDKGWLQMRDAVTTLIHEHLHLNRTCGNDHPERKDSGKACTLFGRDRMDTFDIQDSLWSHLGPDFHAYDRVRIASR